MAGRTVPTRVSNAKLEKISIQLFDYQKQIIKELSERTGIPISVIYRYSVDYFIVAFKGTLSRLGTKVPKDLVKLSEKEMRELLEFRGPID